MRTLLIVEDEKMIRQGISVMAKRTNIPTAQIVECRNGAEALEIISRLEKDEELHVDAMFTDIRMPKMDGIELVERLKGLETPPMVAVISGYDDFNYAVNMLKAGVMDYILKPVKREKIDEILKKMEEKAVTLRQKTQNQQKMFLYDLSRFLEWKEDTLSITGERPPLERLVSWIGEDGYRVIVTGKNVDSSVNCMDVLQIDGRNQQLVFICHEKDVSEFIGKLKAGTGMSFRGRISAKQESGAQVRFCCQQAYEKRIEGFVCGKNSEAQDLEQKASSLKSSPEYEAFAEKFVLQFTTDRYEEAVNQLKSIFFQSRFKKIAAPEAVALAMLVREKLLTKYESAIEQMNTAAELLSEPLYYQTLEEFEQYAYPWMDTLRNTLWGQISADKNRLKINQAVEYIRENYASDLNMAVVSNYISMNYSLFSITFKEYTGVNFVNYLKDLRIEEAKKLLENTDEKIVDISRMVGYDNEKHFMKTFRAVTGVSPSEYRRNTGCR